MIAAAVCAAAAAWLAIRPPTAGLQRLHPTVSSRAASHRWQLALLAVLVAAVAFMLGGAAAVGWVIVAGCCLGVLWWTTANSRRNRLIRSGADETAAAARNLALLLKAGQLPAAAIEQASQDLPVLAPAAAMVQLGVDPAQALQQLAESPGRAKFRDIAAAWQVCHHTGAPVASVLWQVSQRLREDRQRAALVEAELATARASGRVMAFLPFLGLALGVFAGADPVSFLLDSVVGHALLAAAAVLTSIGLVWTERLAQAAKELP
ncbi:MAG: hypothetical protein CSA64_03950 [Arachnia propionica]|nr:MAG: hypothetical protein CSA64_03950 [Arachnia propionica]